MAIKKKIIFFIFFLMSISLRSLAGTNYYVDSLKGNDLNDGRSVDSAWKTIRKANSELRPGDTVYIRGGIYEENNDNSVIYPLSSGIEGNYITYQNYANEVVKIQGRKAGTHPSSLVNIQPSKHHIRIIGLTLTGVSQSESSLDPIVYIAGHHVILQNCIIEFGTDAPGGAMAGIHIAKQGGNTPSHVLILNNIIRYFGKRVTPIAEGEGEGIRLEGNYCLIDGNTISSCGHNCIGGFDGDHNIISNNTMHGDWFRCLGLGGNPRSSIECFTVIENNIIWDVHGQDPWGTYACGFQTSGRQIIFRKNKIYDIDGNGLEIYADKHFPEIKKIMIYNNVVYNAGKMHEPSTSWGLSFNERDPGSLSNCAVKNNIFFCNYSDGIEYRDYADPLEHSVSHNTWNTTDPLFFSASEGDFRIAFDSPCVDSGGFLTKARSSGSGTQLPVEDAGYFSDGFGIAEGDWIQLEGQSETAKILSIDYANHILHLNRSLTWSLNQGVSLAYSGLAPDIGAYEYIPDNPMDLSISASPTAGEIPLTVNFTCAVSGGIPPYSYNWTFGDGQTSSEQKPSHTYSDPGSYTASLTLTDASNNKAAASLTITASPKSVTPLSASIIASPTSGLIPLTVNFTGTATGGAPPYSYNWTFGDGHSSKDQNPSHTYSTIGTFTATLTVTDSKSSSATSGIEIKASAQSTYSLSISSVTGAPAPGQGGTTIPSPGNYSFSVGSTVQVKSIPNPDYRLSKWTGDISDPDIFSLEPTIIINKDKAISAFFCAQCGDVNGDLKITPLDAQRAFDIFLGKIGNPTDCERENADVNADGLKSSPKVTPADAQSIFNKYLKKGEFPSDCSGNSRAAALDTQSFIPANLILTIGDLVITPGKEVIVPVIIDSPSSIEAFGFDLLFPSGEIEFIRLERTEFSENFIQLEANEIAPGILRVGGYGLGSLSKASFGVLTTLIFQVVGNIKENLAFTIIAAYDDLQNATIRNKRVLRGIETGVRTARGKAVKRTD